MGCTKGSVQSRGEKRVSRAWLWSTPKIRLDSTTRNRRDTRGVSATSFSSTRPFLSRRAKLQIYPSGRKRGKRFCSSSGHFAKSQRPPVHSATFQVTLSIFSLPLVLFFHSFFLSPLLAGLRKFSRTLCEKEKPEEKSEEGSHSHWLAQEATLEREKPRSPSPLCSC